MNAIVLDTETTNSLECPLMYDIGWAVIDLDTGELILTRSFAVAEIFLDKELMNTAYYREKLPTYWTEIKEGRRKLAKLSTIERILRTDCKMYEISEIYAHNARFDYLSTTTTQRYWTSSKYRYFFPYGITVCDTLKMARQAFKNDEEYKKFCIDNKYLTKNHQSKFTAEILYQFITKDLNFKEEHRGLDDVLIEKEILMECRKRGITNGQLWED